MVTWRRVSRKRTHLELPIAQFNEQRCVMKNFFTSSKWFSFSHSPNDTNAAQESLLSDYPFRIDTDDLPFPPEYFIGSRFTPPDNQSYLFLGQDPANIQDYQLHVDQQAPFGISVSTTYNQSINIDAHDSTHEELTDLKSLFCDLSKFHAQIWSIELDFHNPLTTDFRNFQLGVFDQQLEAIGELFKSRSEKIFIRIPTSPCQSLMDNRATFWCYLADFWKQQNINNLVWIWSIDPHFSQGPLIEASLNWSKTDLLPPFEYIDWISFPYLYPLSKQYAQLAEQARHMSIPILLTSVFPQGIDIGKRRQHNIGQLTDQKIWNNWYKPFFDYCYENSDVVRGVTYQYSNQHDIDAPMLSKSSTTKPTISHPENHLYGNSCLKDNDYIKAKWLGEICRASWDLKIPYWITNDRHRVKPTLN